MASRPHSPEPLLEKEAYLLREPALAVDPGLKLAAPDDAYRRPEELPAWASGKGEDDHGAFVEVSVEGAKQRLRWIAPGRFLMGAPETEEGRSANGGPQHEVTLTQGFWLASTPCTQALWKAVTGKNPSRFISPQRPVERVSWKDCQRFLEALNGKLPGLDARLPTEAEWEYACRAGSTASSYAPNLGSIAWYCANSGNKTHGVARKEPNAWGLYDMLGNVWEWCADAYAGYAAEAQRDPLRQEGSRRVFRGGSWDDTASYVDAACRLWFGSGIRGDGLGFRLALGQGE